MSPIMPNWIVVCPRCKRSVKYGEIKSATRHHRGSTRDKPLIQPPGVTANCPHCKRSSTFKSCDLTYSYAWSTRRTPDAGEAKILSKGGCMLDIAEQFAHVLLFECPQCGRPLASACASTKKNLEDADAHWFNPHCHCGWTGDVIGVTAQRHWVESWEGNAPIGESVPGSCDGEPLYLSSQSAKV